jgi:hypothetical protein
LLHTKSIKKIGRYPPVFGFFCIPAEISRAANLRKIDTSRPGERGDWHLQKLRYKRGVSRILKESKLEGEAAEVLEGAAKLLKAYKDELPEENTATKAEAKVARQIANELKDQLGSERVRGQSRRAA